MKILFLCTLLVALVGCKSTPQSIAIKSEGVIITSVDLGMKGWATYVNAGKATQQQVDTVKSAYNTYYNAQLIAESALTMYIQTGSTNATTINATSAEVSVAETALLNILNQYIK